MNESRESKNAEQLEELLLLTEEIQEELEQKDQLLSLIHIYKTLKGYCFMSCKTIYVMISSFLSEEEKMIVAAHELGHIILHRSQLKMAPMQDDTPVSYTHLPSGA